MLLNSNKIIKKNLKILKEFPLLHDNGNFFISQLDYDKFKNNLREVIKLSLLGYSEIVYTNQIASKVASSSFYLKKLKEEVSLENITEFFLEVSKNLY